MKKIIITKEEFATLKNSAKVLSDIVGDKNKRFILIIQRAFMYYMGTKSICEEYDDTKCDEDIQNQFYMTMTFLNQNYNIPALTYSNIISIFSTIVTRSEIDNTSIPTECDNQTNNVDSWRDLIFASAEIVMDEIFDENPSEDKRNIFDALYPNMVIITDKINTSTSQDIRWVISNIKEIADFGVDDDIIDLLNTMLSYALFVLCASENMGGDVDSIVSNCNKLTFCKYMKLVIQYKKNNSMDLIIDNIATLCDNISMISNGNQLTSDCKRYTPLNKDFSDDNNTDDTDNTTDELDGAFEVSDEEKRRTQNIINELKNLAKESDIPDNNDKINGATHLPDDDDEYKDSSGNCSHNNSNITEKLCDLGNRTLLLLYRQYYTTQSYKENKFFRIMHSNIVKITDMVDTTDVSRAIRQLVDDIKNMGDSNMSNIQLINMLNYMLSEVFCILCAKCKIESLCPPAEEMINTFHMTNINRATSLMPKAGCRNSDIMCEVFTLLNRMSDIADGKYQSNDSGDNE